MSDESIKYKFLERKVRGQAYVDVHVLPLPVPRYSFKVGALRVTRDENGQDIVREGPWLNSFSFEDAASLLMEVGSEYEEKRDEAKNSVSRRIGEVGRDTNKVHRAEVIKKRSF